MLCSPLLTASASFAHFLPGCQKSHAGTDLDTGTEVKEEPQAGGESALLSVL